MFQSILVATSSIYFQIVLNKSRINQIYRNFILEKVDHCISRIVCSYFRHKLLLAFQVELHPVDVFQIQNSIYSVINLLDFQQRMYPIFIFFILFVSNAQLTSFRSTFKALPIARFTPIVFTVSNSRQSPDISSIYWENNRDSRLSYFQSSNHYLNSINRYPNYKELSRHTGDITKLMKFRRLSNGTENNINNTRFCSSSVPLKRLTPPLYADGINKLMDSKYHPRVVSNTVGKANYPLKLNRNNVTMAFTIWGQFLDHDISLTEVDDEELKIEIPRCDLFMDTQCEGTKFIPFKRSRFSNQSKYRDQITSVTGWVDGSMVYGSSDQDSDRLRTFKDGKMKTSEGNLLPPKLQDPFNLPDAGDIRAAENLLLLSYQTLFVRQHNRLCNVIIQKDSNMTDEQIYLAAKNYVVGLIQKITYEDFLPILLGQNGNKKYVGRYFGYNSTVDPTIMNQFSTIAYRFGHSLLVGKLPLINQNQEVQKSFNLNDMFFRSDLMDNNLLQKLLRGLTYTITKQKDGTLIDEIRNLLITGPENRHIHLDLLALNIQRARDHGLERYNYIRKIFKLQPLKNFLQLTGEPTRAKVLSDFYGNDINAMDPFIGILNEKGLEGGILGELGAEIVGLTFKNLRSGDRFWYENTFQPNIIAQIKGTFLSELFIRNTDIKELQEDIFHYRTQYVRNIKQ